ncbi:MAG: TRAP transporter large permease subunit, partial [Pigmentiphaga sp.]
MTYAASVEPGQEPGLTRMPLRKSWLDSAAAMLKRASHILSGLGVLLMLLVGAVMVVDVLVLRYLLRSPIVGSNEVYAAVAAVAISFLLAGGLASRSMLEVDVLAGKLGARPIAWLRCSGLALFLACLSVLAIALFEQAVNAFESGFTSSLLGIAFWPSYALIFLAVALTVPVMIVNLLLSFRELPHQGLAARLSAPVFGFLLFAVGIALALRFQSLWHGNMIAFGAGVLLLLWIFILFFIPVAAALIFSSLIGIVALLGWDAAVSILGSESLGLFTSVDISVIPFFLMMGGFAVASGMAADIYRFANALLSPFRGGLALATVWGCAGFGALCGSSIATVATIGSAAYPEMKQRGYSTQLSSGSIAAGGTLGQLIPPSTVIIVYALLVGESIGQLY